MTLSIMADCYAVPFVLSVIYAYCRKIGLNAECHYAECRYTECIGAVIYALM